MTADNAKIIDRGEELQKIKDKYGRRYCIEPEATEEAAKLWGVEANEHGVPLNVETECVLNFQRAFASVHLASTSKGQWLVGISASTAVSGLGYYPSAWDRTGYADYDTARKEALLRLRSYFGEAVRGRELQAILIRLADAETPQLELF